VPLVLVVVAGPEEAAQAVALPPGHYVNMQVGHALADLVVYGHKRAVGVDRGAHRDAEAAGRGEQRLEEVIGQLVEALDVLAGHQECVPGKQGPAVEEGDGVLLIEHDVGTALAGDDLTESAESHGVTLPDRNAAKNASHGILSYRTLTSERIHTVMPTLKRCFVPLVGALLVGSALVAVPDAAAADEPPTCFGRQATVWGSGLLEGTAGNDVIVGSSGADTIYGYAGADIICGLGGNDTIYGASGEDRIKGGPGGDFINGGSSADIIRGEGGNDLLIGGSGRDQIRGGTGNDEIRGSKGADEMMGGPGNDHLLGGAGDDFMFGEGGGDVLEGRGGDDLLYGGSGVDRLRGNRGADELWAGECRESGAGVGHFCRATPSGRAANGAAETPGDILFGGVYFDSCNGGAQKGCETYRGWRGSGRSKATAEEWRDEVTAAFTTFGVEEEIEHAMQIIACESLGDPFQVTQAGTVYSTRAVAGLFQHRVSAWSSRASLAGVRGQSAYSPWANAHAAAYLVSEDIDAGRDPWDDWTCDEVLIRLGLWE
jgi:hypothetical protein